MEALLEPFVENLRQMSALDYNTDYRYRVAGVLQVLVDLATKIYVQSKTSNPNFKVVSCDPFAHGTADVLVKYNNRILFAAEEHNLAKTSYLNEKVARNDLRHLKGIPLKAIITTFPSTVDTCREVHRLLHAIPIHYIGFQLLPPDIYYYVRRKNPEKVSFSSPAPFEAFERLKKDLLGFYDQIGLDRRIYSIS